MFGLSNNAIQLIQEVFRKYPKVEKAVLYGSRGKETYRPGSDIDLTLLGESLDLSMLQKIELDDLMLPYKIDLSIHHKIKNSDFLEHIQRVGKIFYEKVE